MAHVRTRFAPSPTGELHLGNARTAVLNWLFARHHAGEFILRFEDTDAERQVDTAEGAIRAGLDWLGLDRDEGPGRGGPRGPYRQSERLDLYHDFADRLLEEGLAYPCYCLPEELEARRSARMEAGGQPAYDGRCQDLSAAEVGSFSSEGRLPAIRFRVAPGPVVFRDRLRGEIIVDASDFGDMVLLRSDGRPTYNFAVVVDDVLMEITHVIRGATHLANTPKQVLLYQALGRSLPEFVHVPTVLAPGGGKLSKREGAPGLDRYRTEGYHPDAVLNYLSLLSWSSPSGQELLSREELIRQMDLDRLGKSQPVVDLEKMRWLSGQHIRKESLRRLEERLTQFMEPDRYGLSARDLAAFAEVLQPRINLLQEAVEEAERIFGQAERSPEAAALLANAETGQVLSAVAEEWEHLRDWKPGAIKKAVLEAGNKAGVRGGALFRPLRVALTGESQGPDLADIAYVLGRERTVRRIHQAIGKGIDRNAQG